MNLTDTLIRHADTAPDHPAFVFIRSDGDAQTWTYAELRERISNAALALAAAVKPPVETAPDLAAQELTPPRVLIALPNHPDYILAFFGAMYAGLVAVPVSDQLTDHELNFIARDAGAHLIVSDRDLTLDADHTPVVAVRSLAEILNGTHTPGLTDHTDGFAHHPTEPAARGPAAHSPAATKPETPAFLMYTSGTTGSPKGVLHAHRVLRGRLPMRDGWTGLRTSDRLLHAGKLGWTYTLGVGLMDTWAAGATALVFGGDHDPARWPALIRDHGATIFAAVPTVYRQILKYAADGPIDLPTLRHALSAGEALPSHIRASWRSRVGTEIYEALGMSECSTYVSCSPTVPIIDGAVGRPQAGRRITILDPNTLEPVGFGGSGLLAVDRRDEGLMLRYWNRPIENAAVIRGDWFVGGDCGHIDENGYFWFEGRNDDMLNAMGHRVSPEEVEAALAAHSSVVEVGVAESTPRADVSVVTAWIVAQQAVSSYELAVHCGHTLAPYKVPRCFRFVEALPRSRNGKLQRGKLNELAVGVSASVHVGAYRIDARSLAAASDAATERRLVEKNSGADAQPLYEQARRLRNEVLLRPNGIPDFGWEMLDGEAMHFLAVLDARVVGCALLVVGEEAADTGRLMQMAVDPTIQRAGIGRKLVDALTGHARELQLASVHCHAQLPPVGFYKRLGFVVEGEHFWEAGIEHVSMRIALEPATDPT